MLIRFFRNQDYAEQFLSGKIFCNSLNYFRSYPDCTLEGNELAKDKCTDFLEGSAQLLREYFPYKDLLDHIGCDPHIVFSEYSKAHLCCFSSVQTSLPKEMEQFGEWCVLILDFKTFEKKIKKSLNSQNNLYYLYGGVEYYKPTINRNIIKDVDNSIVFSVDGCRIFFDESNPAAFIKRDAFNKFLRFRSQQEWRLFFYKEGFSQNSWILTVEDLHDCCILFPTSEANNKIRELQKTNPFCNSVSLHIKGNISRDRLNKMIIEKDPWGHMHFLLGGKDIKAKDKINTNQLVKGLKIKRVEEPSRATIRGFF